MGTSDLKDPPNENLLIDRHEILHVQLRQRDPECVKNGYNRYFRGGSHIVEIFNDVTFPHEPCLTILHLFFTNNPIDRTAKHNV